MPNTATAADPGRALLRHFDALWIINLPERTDRRRETVAELARVGLAPGRDGVAFFDGIRGDAAHGFATAGAYGCFRSHLAVLEQAQAQGHRAVLVAEDDLEFRLPFAHDLDSVLAPLAGDDWDFFYPAYHYHDRFLSEGSGLLDLGDRYDIGGLHLYAVHRRILPALIASMHQRIADNRAGKPGPGYPDPHYSAFRAANPGIVTQILSPGIADQRASRSDIVPARLYDRVPGVRQAVALLRRLR